MKYFRKLVGDRCYLSPIDPDDIEIYTAWLNDQEVVRWLNTAQMSISLPGERAALERLAQEHNYAIVLKDGDELIGNVGLARIDAINRHAVLGVFIGNKACWEQGYGAEAIRLLLGYAFDCLNIHAVMLHVFAPNERARACYRKVGFKEVGRIRQSVFRDGRHHDAIVMDILADEFRTGRA